MLRPRTCPDYHCDLGQINPSSDKRDFRPFKSAQEMTAFLGIDVDEWFKRQQQREAMPVRSTNKRQQKVNIFKELLA